MALAGPLTVVLCQLRCFKFFGMLKGVGFQGFKLLQ
jgi:hypothetical protein